MVGQNKTCVLHVPTLGDPSTALEHTTGTKARDKQDGVEDARTGPYRCSELRGPGPRAMQGAGSGRQGGSRARKPGLDWLLAVLALWVPTTFEMDFSRWAH